VTKTSSRFTMGTTARSGVSVVIAEPAAEQSWQGCAPLGAEFRSAQKWNCAARKMIPSSKAQNRALLGLTDIFLLRRSLGRNGCGVKQRIWEGSTFCILRTVSNVKGVRLI
jgi:hypothetical protein